jgi:hypothetical protein
MFSTYFTFMLPCIVMDFLLNNQPDALIIPIYSVIKLYTFPPSSLPIIRNFLLYIRQWSRILWTSDQPVAETSTWQHTTLTTDIHPPGGIRTRNPSKRGAADPRLRSRGHQNRHTDDVIHSRSMIPFYSRCYIDNKYAFLSLFTEVSAWFIHHELRFTFRPLPTSAWT